MKTIVHVVGARPNYMKIAPLMEALRPSPAFRQVLVNTGQHYDDMMAGAFVRDLTLPTPDHDLGVGSASHAVQTARVMIEFEKVCAAEQPDLVVVVGDVNSTLAASLVAAKLPIPVAHVEAGLRSRDRTMPEEINRIVTDHLSDLLLTPSADANENLLAEGVLPAKIHLVGNIMIDSLLRHLPFAQLERVSDRIPVEAGGYAVLTLHRPSNVDNLDVFGRILKAISIIADDLPVVFPVHPRTRRRMCELGPHRFRRTAGGIHGTRDSLSDASREHRAADHGDSRDEPGGRLRHRLHSCRIPAGDVVGRTGCPS
jgi:UDP-N-acetylglucosamine 2-epimerase (non-hydrolysing)